MKTVDTEKLKNHVDDLRGGRLHPDCPNDIADAIDWIEHIKKEVAKAFGVPRETMGKETKF